MRDMHRMRERAAVQIDRGKLATFSLGLVVALAAAFSAGYVVGKRTTALASEVKPAPIAAIDTAQERHEQLTFYTKLSDKAPVVPPKPAPTVETAVQRLRQLAKPEAQPPAREAERSIAEIVAVETAAPAIPVGTVGTSSGLEEGPALHGDYTVQVSAFRTHAEAEAYAASLERRGYKPFIVESTTPERGTWFRVRMGRFADEGAAQRAKEELASAAIPAWVLRADP